MMNKEVFLRIDGYGRSPGDGTFPISDDIYNVA